MTTTDEKTSELRSKARAEMGTLPPVEYPASTNKPPVARCRSCQRPIWWRQNPSGKRQPMDYDLVTAKPLDMPHHATCPQGREWQHR